MTDNYDCDHTSTVCPFCDLDSATQEIARLNAAITQLEDTRGEKRLIPPPQWVLDQVFPSERPVFHHDKQEWWARMKPDQLDVTGTPARSKGRLLIKP